MMDLEELKKEFFKTYNLYEYITRAMMALIKKIEEIEKNPPPEIFNCLQYSEFELYKYSIKFKFFRVNIDNALNSSPSFSVHLALLHPDEDTEDFFYRYEANVAGDFINEEFGIF